MNRSKTISDLHLHDLQPERDRLVVLRDDDHLLRRFGQVEVRTLPPNSETDFTLRAVADEVWAPLGGRAEITLVDRREGSPSERHTVRIELDATQPQALLIPFGVAYAIATTAEARLLRLTTHADGSHDGDEVMSRDALAKYTRDG